MNDSDHFPFPQPQQAALIPWSTNGIKPAISLHAPTAPARAPATHAHAQPHAQATPTKKKGRANPHDLMLAGIRDFLGVHDQRSLNHFIQIHRGTMWEYDGPTGNYSQDQATILAMQNHLRQVVAAGPQATEALMQALIADKARRDAGVSAPQGGYPAANSMSNPVAGPMGNPAAMAAGQAGSPAAAMAAGQVGSPAAAMAAGQVGSPLPAVSPASPSSSGSVTPPGVCPTCGTAMKTNNPGG